ncbi:annexin domain-containing protein [Ditylenchus destructor]|nr:annexin domain-containing protein [Ditylenchus destructor]
MQYLDHHVFSLISCFASVASGLAAKIAAGDQTANNQGYYGNAQPQNDLNYPAPQHPQAPFNNPPLPPPHSQYQSPPDGNAPGGGYGVNPGPPNTSAQSYYNPAGPGGYQQQGQGGYQDQYGYRPQYDPHQPQHHPIDPQQPPYPSYGTPGQLNNNAPQHNPYNQYNHQPSYNQPPPPHGGSHQDNQYQQYARPNLPPGPPPAQGYPNPQQQGYPPAQPNGQVGYGQPYQQGYGAPVAGGAGYGGMPASQGVAPISSVDASRITPVQFVPHRWIIPEILLYNPTVYAKVPFDAGTYASELSNKLNRLDKVGAMIMLATLNRDQRKLVSNAFPRYSRGGKTLIKQLESVLSEKHEKKLALALGMDLPHLLASDLKESMEGFGTDETTLFSILVSLNNSLLAEIRAIYSAYQKKRHGKDALKEAVKSELSGVCKEMAARIVDGEREEYKPVDMAQLDRDVKLLNRGMARDYGDILARRSYVHIQKIIDRIPTIKDKVQNYVAGDWSSDLRKLCEYVLDAARNFTDWMSGLLYLTMKGPKATKKGGTDDDALTRWIVLAEDYMRSIVEKYPNYKSSNLITDVCGEGEVVNHKPYKHGIFARIYGSNYDTSKTFC